MDATTTPLDAALADLAAMAAEYNVTIDVYATPTHATTTTTDDDDDDDPIPF